MLNPNEQKNQSSAATDQPATSSQGAEATKTSSAPAVFGAGESAQPKAPESQPGQTVGNQDQKGDNERPKGAGKVEKKKGWYGNHDMGQNPPGMVSGIPKEEPEKK